MNIPLQNGQLPQGFCPPDYQTMLNGFTAQQYVSINSLASIIVSSTPPGASDHDKAWLQLDSSGRPVRLYFFAQGAWLSPHPLQPGFTMIWNQALPNFQTFDGGDASAAPFAAISGQMWQLMATTLDGLGTQVAQAQFPAGVGTLPSGALVTLGGVGGEEVHRLTQQELFPHSHTVLPTIGGGLLKRDSNFNTVDPNGSIISDQAQGGAPGAPPLVTGNTGGDPAQNPPTQALGHNTLPPFYGVYFLQRTNRLFYVV